MGGSDKRSNLKYCGTNVRRSMSFGRKIFCQQAFGQEPFLWHNITMNLPFGPYVIKSSLSLLYCMCRPNVCRPNVCQPNICRPNVCWPNVCQPNVCQPNICRPNVCWPNVCWRNVCWPNVCQPNVCRPNVCRPNVCQPNGFRPKDFDPSIVQSPGACVNRLASPSYFCCARGKSTFFFSYYNFFVYFVFLSFFPFPSVFVPLS
jgi:hypothetical protein